MAQFRNVVLILYDLHRRPAIYVPNRNHFTHAWLPRDRFDAVLERDGWIFARRADGYLAIRSCRPYRWQTLEGEDCAREVLVPGRRNAWICELGRRAHDGPFESFVEKVTRAEIAFGPRRVRYHSPSQGRLELAWHGPLRRNGQPVPLADYPRYDTPWVQAPFDPSRIEVRCAGDSLDLDWARRVRRVSAFLD